MGYKRKSTRQPWRPKKKPRYAKKFKPSRSIMSRQIHWFKRRTGSTAITGDGIANVQFRGFNFLLSSVVNSGEFSALYDQYKLTGIALDFYLNRNSANASVVNGVLPRMYIVTDYNTSTAPTDIDELKEYSNCRVHDFTPEKNHFRYYLRPKILMEVYRTALTTGTAPRKPMWISTDHLDLQHFGVRLAVTNLQDADYTVVIEPTFYFGCKNVK